MFKELTKAFMPFLLSSKKRVMPQNDAEPSDEDKNINLNNFTTKKTIAQGMLDIALLTANASQLKYVLQTGSENHPFYHLMLSLISISIILQIICGILLLVLGSVNINKNNELKRADALNNLTSIFIFFITLINVLISAFGIEHVVQEEIKKKVREQLIAQQRIYMYGGHSRIRFDDSRIL